MKKLFLILACVFISKLILAQTKDLPECKTIGTELNAVNNSFDNIVEKFKSKEDKVSLVKTYFSDFSICGEKGKIKDYGRNVEFIFYFTDAYYKGSRYEFRDFYKKIFKKLKHEFTSTHVYKIAKEQTGKSSYFYEKDKGITTSKKNIKLLLSYKDPLDETTTYSVSLIFEYYPKR
jgi:hypothetical protein